MSVNGFISLSLVNVEIISLKPYKHSEQFLSGFHHNPSRTFDRFLLGGT